MTGACCIFWLTRGSSKVCGVVGSGDHNILAAKRRGLPDAEEIQFNATYHNGPRQNARQLKELGSMDPLDSRICGDLERAGYPRFHWLGSSNSCVRAALSKCKAERCKAGKSDREIESTLTTRLVVGGGHRLSRNGILKYIVQDSSLRLGEGASAGTLGNCPSDQEHKIFEVCKTGLTLCSDPGYQSSRFSEVLLFAERGNMENIA
ncbi:hypothetical protein C8R48DRAFT_673389 [Suillus tomentosus]|nr:hypothetical protein C8R48DRAFT_673389 [Suillus tomentosus]